jgi:signal transduction histidine kinase/DNA-binding response OmpR family regulator
MDNQGILWISTSNGLCRLNPKDGKTKNFFVSDGLQGNEYNKGTSFHDPVSDLLLFGGTRGVSYFYPPKATQEPAKPRVTLTGVYRGSERVLSYMKSGRYTICEDAISFSEEFNFSHEDNTLSFSFSTLTYSDVEHISFAYSINGDKEVMLPAGENRITLSRMAPGDYNFRVVAINNGVRSQEKTFKVTIHNPWYFTPLAKIIYILLILAAIWWYIHLQRVRNRERLLIQEHIHKEELNEQKLRFFINISHEIRTPMTLIVTPLLQLIREDNDPHRQSVYEIMKRNAERILHLVNQILDLRKIDKGQMVMQMRETDLIYFTEDILKIFQPQATSKKINLEFIHESEKLPVWIDRGQFDKIIINLMSNAMKYTPVCGTVRVTITSDDKNVTISVFDNGEQIPEQSLARIFERFYQAASLTNQTKTGTGVGLDLTRSLVQLHHGDIIARNVEDGVEFVVTIPQGCEHLSKEELTLHEEQKAEDISSILEQELVNSAEAESIEEKLSLIQDSKPSTPSSKRPTIVVVEDDDEIRNYLIAELESTYRILSFSDGAEALPVILREIPALVVSDVMMPQMDGNTLCAKIKSNVNTNHVPVILLTAKTRDEDRLESLETGADLYFTKPFNMDILRRSIANLIASRRLMENKFTGKEDHSEQIDDIEIESADEKLLNRILAVVNANLGNSDLNIDMICTEVGISRVHLHRKMKELTNQTPHDFIRNLRLKQAARLLSRKGQNITEVMYRCGFNSTTSFSTMFKKMYGLSPREYMKEHAE